MRDALARVSFLSLSLLPLLGCVTTRRAESPHDDTDYCAPAQIYRYDPSLVPARDARSAASAEVLQHYSPQELLFANAAGILPLLDELEAASGERRSAVQAKIQTRLLLFSATIESTAAELDCEGERADRVATTLDQTLSRRTTLLTVSSIVVGAAASIFMGISQDNDANRIAGIAGGAASAGLGLTALFSTAKVRYSHARNALADVWQEREHSEILPPPIWFVLKERSFSNDQKYSISHNIRRRWIDAGYVDASGKGAPYFGRDGEYALDELRARANMLNQLQAAVRLINQNLQELLLDLSARHSTP
jgi:hypothetical protein